jgi:hypothetical protein
MRIYLKLSGIGEHLAEQIINERPYQSLDDLTRVPGISGNVVDQLRPYLAISNTITDTQIQEDAENLDETENIEVPGVQEDSKQDSSVDISGSDELDERIDQDIVGVIDDDQAFDSDIDSKPSDVEHEEDADQENEISDVEHEKDTYQESEPSDVEHEEDADQENEISDVEHEEDADQENEISDDLDIVEDESDFVSDVDTESSQRESDQMETQLPVKTDEQKSYITRGGTCSLLLIGGLLTIILSVAITLGILSSINQGQLDYASPSQVASLQSQLELLASESKSLASDIDGMRLRIDNLESLTGQISKMETEIIGMNEEIDQLQTQMEANQIAVEDMNLQIEDIQEEIDILSTQGDRFESFLDGMRNLLEELFPQTTEVEETP